MEITLEMAKEAYEDLGPIEQQTLVNILGDLQQKYIMYITHDPNAIDLPYFFYSLHQNTIFNGISFESIYLAEDYVGEFIMKSMYYIALFLKSRRQK